MKTKYLEAATLLLLMGFLIASGIRDAEYRASMEEYKALEERVEEPVESEEEQEETEEETPYPVRILDYDALTSMNQDFVAWIYIPLLDISYPVVQGVDDEVYLYQSFGKQSNRAGCTFLDAYNKNDFTSMSNFIFGHNMRNGTMFGNLKNLYRSPEEFPCAENPYIYIYREDEVIQYEIFAYQLIHRDSNLYRDINTEEEYAAYTEEVMAGNMEPHGKMPDYGVHRLLTLSTCSGTDGQNRFLVQAIEKERFEIQ
ncbi:MAG: class B sortase [Lachnospiraceae bacterium]|nr:class B sortase [Lachnospiraceae bacterium]